MDIGGLRTAPASQYVGTASREEPKPSATRAVATEIVRIKAVEVAAYVPSATAKPAGQIAAEIAAREQTLRTFIDARSIEARSTVDPRTREIVRSAVDTRTGEVVNQFPEEARLKFREYLARLQESQNAARTEQSSVDQNRRETTARVA